MPIDTANLRVLLLDDDWRITEGLRRHIHQHHPGWKVHQSIAVADALRVLDRHALEIDVAVCDINMPEVPGTQLLKLIRDAYPWMVRITLSGMLDAQSLVDSNKYAECKLVKPLAAERLCAEIVRLCGERGDSTPPRVMPKESPKPQQETQP